MTVPYTSGDIEVITVQVPGFAGPVGPANQLAIGTITTSPSGSSATASITGEPPNQVLNLGIPRGLDAPATADATITAKGVIQLAGDLAGTAAAPTVPGLAEKANTSHTHTSTNISDSTAVGRSVITAVDAAAARTAIGAGTSSLVIGTTSTTAKAGNYAPPADGAANVASMRTLGTGSLQAVAGNDTRLSDARTPTAHTHGVVDLTATGTRDATTFLRGDNTWAALTQGSTSVTSSQITDSTVVGRSLITAVDAPAARTAIGAGTSNLVIGTTSTTAKAGNYVPPAASATASGIVELATTAEATTGTDTVRAVTPAGLKTVADTKANLASVEGLVFWDGTAWPARPTGYARVVWVGGTVRPTAMATGDIWEHDV